MREIDGARFDDLAGFWEEVSRQLVPGADWGRNFDAFNDILRGGFGTPDDGFVLRWFNSERSRVVLGHEAMVRWLTDRLAHGHPANRPFIQQELELASRGEGRTIFDFLVEIIRIHGPGGDEAQDRVDLELL